jgi:amino acid transporter
MGNSFIVRPAHRICTIQILLIERIYYGCSKLPSPTMKKTLGLTGVTVNAMALIAPGAFLWMTYQLQAANTDISGKSTALDMWTGIVVALIVAFLTAFAFAELARRYPNAGSGSAYYFAEKAFLDRENPFTGVLPGLPNLSPVGLRIYFIGSIRASWSPFLPCS